MGWTAAIWSTGARFFMWASGVCLGLAQWCEPAATHVLVVPKDDLYHRALYHVTAAEARAGAGTSGIYKRWEMVYPKLVHEFPAVTHAAINRAIEAAVSLK